MVSSTALHVFGHPGHQLLVFMKPFLEQQGIFWHCLLPGAEPQQAVHGAPLLKGKGTGCWVSAR